jgi:hypothetical protein
VKEPEDLLRLDEFTKEAWWDVFRAFRPEATWEEYEAEWQRFQDWKADHLRRAALN